MRLAANECAYTVGSLLPGAAVLAGERDTNVLDEAEDEEVTVLWLTRVVDCWVDLFVEAAGDSAYDEREATEDEKDWWCARRVTLVEAFLPAPCLMEGECDSFSSQCSGDTGRGERLSCTTGEALPE